MNISFTEKVAKSVSGKVFHLKINDNVRLKHVFLFVTPVQEIALKNLLNEAPEEITDLADFGHVVGTCWGMFPTESIRKKLKEEYGAEF